MKKRYPIGPALFLLVLVFFVVLYQQKPLPAQDDSLGQPAISSSEDRDNPPPTETARPTPTAAPSRPPVSIEIAAVGDLLMHRPITDGALVDGTQEDPKYDFRPNFQFIKPSIERADLAVYNLETTLNGPPYSGFPLFSAPDEIGTSLWDVGFNVVSTANNHIFDKGVEGFERTNRVLREQGYAVIGTRLDEDEPRDVIMEIEGYKIGLTAYTYETIGTPDQPALNALPLPEEIVPLVNSFNPYREDRYRDDLRKMTEHVDELKARGAQFICFVMHWGEEYKTESRPYQREMAQALIDAGVDLIFGHHPHVLQEIDVLEAADSQRQGLVFYSLGNLVTNMTYDQMGIDGLSQDGLIARVYLSGQGDMLTIEKAEYIPTHVVQAPDQGRTRHFVVPVRQGLKDPAAFLTQAGILEDSLARTEAILADLPQDIEILQVER